MTPSACAASSSGSLEGVVVVAGLAAGAAFLLWAERCWALRRLDAWATREGLVILERDRRRFRRGPFDPMAQYIVFRIRARLAAGTERRGWVRLGGRFNVWSDDAEARWDGAS
jgi:hypothetical protein